MAIPVGTFKRWSGSITTGSASAACRSIPDEPAVWYRGSGTSISPIRTTSTHTSGTMMAG